MRVAFTIVYNGLHHLKHNDFAEKMCSMFDLWVVVEGSAGTAGSTGWCKPVERYHTSIDGTVEYLKEIQGKHPGKLILQSCEEQWSGKDEMVNAAIALLHKAGITSCNLWQVDVDEQWSEKQLQSAERTLKNKGAKTGMFLSDFYLAPDLIVKGHWGESRMFPYRRLWRWEGEYFRTHEPPCLTGGNGREVLLAERFAHYSYFFEQDVYFKSQYYSGHETVYESWMKLLIEKPKLSFPIHISQLFGRGHHFGRTHTYIHKTSKLAA